MAEQRGRGVAALTAGVKASWPWPVRGAPSDSLRRGAASAGAIAAAVSTSDRSALAACGGLARRCR